MSKNQFPAISRQNRLKAIEEGKLTYESGSTCKNCGTNEKYVKNSSCVSCVKQKTLNRSLDVYKKYFQSEKGKERNKQYRKSEAYKAVQKKWLDNTNYGTFRQSLRRKQIRDTTKDLSIEELNQIKSIYKKAAQLRQETGKMYHVDHIIRLADNGPHNADNLQILDEDSHKQKTYTENRKEASV